MFNYLDILAKNINRYLEKNYKRPSWLAEKSGVKPPNLSKILGRSGNPTLGTIAALADAMEMQPSDLIRLYKDDDQFEYIMLTRKLRIRELELKHLETQHERATRENRPSTEVHPHTIAIDIKRHKELIEQIEGKLRALEYLFEQNPGPQKTLHQTLSSPPASDNRKALIGDIVTGLSSLDESELRAVLRSIDDFAALRGGSKPNSATNTD